MRPSKDPPDTCRLIEYARSAAATGKSDPDRLHSNAGLSDDLVEADSVEMLFRATWTKVLLKLEKVIECGQQAGYIGR